jgi:LmbE family N-acetylglucosaminyl deacetylase
MTNTGGLLAIFAHPDDETFGLGGTMAHYSGRGIPVTMVSATRGEVGEISPGTDATPETLGTFREQELRDAMAILGVDDVRFLPFRDSGMFGTPENKDPRNLVNAAADAVIEPLVRMIRERRPDVIATWDESGGYGHPDHVAVHHHATAAFHAAADATRFPMAGDPWQAPRLFYTAIPMAEFGRVMEEMRSAGVDVPDIVEDPRMETLRRVEPNCIIDVAAYFERKERAMLAHRTQITDMDPFMRIPLDVRQRFFGREYFYCAHPGLDDGAIVDDLLAPLR